MTGAHVTAEWPGRVAEVRVAVGDSVQAEQELFTLESLKMLASISAPSDGQSKANDDCALVDEVVDSDEDFGDSPILRRRERGQHLHRLERDEFLSRGDLVANRYMDLRNAPRPLGPNVGRC